MDKTLEEGCKQFATMALGRSLRPNEFESLIQGANSLAEFRVLLATHPDHRASFAPIVDRWITAVPPSGRPSKSIGSLTHQVEQMAMRIGELEDRLDSQANEILGAMQRLDQLLQGHQVVATNLREMSSALQSYRARLLEIDARSKSQPHLIGAAP